MRDEGRPSRKPSKSGLQTTPSCYGKERGGEHGHGAAGSGAAIGVPHYLILFVIELSGDQLMAANLQHGSRVAIGFASTAAMTPHSSPLLK
jgi:hypothetical protein